MWLAVCARIITGAAFGCVFWRYLANETMRKRIRRALFKVGYSFYANTRIGRWFNERCVRKALLKFGEDGHTKTVTSSYGSLRISPIPCMFDNYAYVVVDISTNDAVVIDAGDGPTVQRFLQLHSLTPKAVLTTHRHWDHCGGNAFLKQHYPSLCIYGSATDHPDGVNKFVAHEQQISIGSLDFVGYSTPGHTRGHTIYHLKGPKYGAHSDCLFTGDLLFIAGCGKLFEGTAEEMLKSLDFVCTTIPDSTLIWPGHEYTVANLIFSCTISNSNEAARDKLTWARHQRLQLLPTCPSTLKEEMQYSLFLRTADTDLQREQGFPPAGMEAEEASNDKTTTDDDDDDSAAPLAAATTIAFKQRRLELFTYLRKRKDEWP